MSKTPVTRRPRLDQTRVIDAAEDLVADRGWDALTMSALAERLGVRPPALYRYVETIDALRTDLHLRLIEGMATAVRAAVMGRSGQDGLRAIAEAYRKYALDHPRQFLASLPLDSPEAKDQGLRAGEAGQAVLRSFGLDEAQMHIATAQLAAIVHGFVVIELAQGLDWVDREAAFEGLVEMFANSIRQRVRDRQGAEPYST